MIIDSGSHAVTGIGRSSCNVGSSSPRTMDSRPISMPSGNAIAAASRNAP